MSWIPELPLLRRELTELANRRRTYIIRVVGAVTILFFVFAAYNWAMTSRLNLSGGLSGAGVAQYLGVGRDVFAQITPILFFAIQLLMPAFCCACITSEKENNTIGTLLLTRLSPKTIIMEKFLSRLVPMLTLLLLTFPVLAHVLTLGGVDTNMLVGTLWLLFCECLLFASIALLCSSFFATTVSAFTVSYCLTGCLAMMSLSLQIHTFVPSAIWTSIYRYGRDITGSASTAAFFQSVLSSVGLSTANGPPLWLWMVLKSIPSLVVTFGCLLMARVVLVRRAFPSHASAMLKFFKHVDTFFRKLNDRTTGGIVLIKDSTPMPGDQPLVWREQYKKSLGKARYLFRILVFLEGPTLFACASAATLGNRGAFFGLYVMEIFIWIFAVLVASAKAATLFSSERAQQTIEPLLATPMGSVDMLNQKVAGMKRLLIVLATPILTVNFTHVLLNTNSGASTRVSIYVLLTLWSTYVLLHLVTWLSAGIGLKIHSQTRAVLASVTVIGVLTTIPLAMLSYTNFGYETSQVILTCTPVSAVANTESYLREIYGGYGMTYRYGRQQKTYYLFWAMTSVTIYTVLFVAVRFAVRRLSPRLLGRREVDADTDYRVSIDHSPVLEGSQT